MENRCVMYLVDVYNLLVPTGAAAAKAAKAMGAAIAVNLMMNDVYS